MKKEIQVTSLTKLKEYSAGQVVELPPFAEGMPFIARLRRPSLLALCKSGRIPNSLLSTANSLFTGRPTEKKAAKADTQMREYFEVFDAICEAAFVEPTWDELKQNNIQLTDDQYTYIFNYTQNGVKALESFRIEQTNLRSDSTK